MTHPAWTMPEPVAVLLEDRRTVAVLDEAVRAFKAALWDDPEAIGAARARVEQAMAVCVERARQARAEER